MTAATNSTSETSPPPNGTEPVPEATGGERSKLKNRGFAQDSNAGNDARTKKV